MDLKPVKCPFPVCLAFLNGSGLHSLFFLGCVSSLYTYLSNLWWSQIYVGSDIRSWKPVNSISYSLLSFPSSLQYPALAVMAPKAHHQLWWRPKLPLPLHFSPVFPIGTEPFTFSQFWIYQVSSDSHCLAWLLCGWIWLPQSYIFSLHCNLFMPNRIISPV